VSTPLWCGIDHEHDAIVAFEPGCGCVAALSVLTHSEADAYKTAAREAKAGMRVETMKVEAARAMPWTCPEHPKGPPWWKSNGGKGKR